VAKRSKQSLGIIGAGAFGSLMAKHLAPHFALVICDSAAAKAKSLAKKTGSRAGNLKDAAGCDIVVLSVPVQKMESAIRDVAPLLKHGALVLDVGSVKIKPAALMRKLLPEHADIVGTHPLFGPQTGKNGIKGLNVVVADIRGGRGACVAKFLAKKLKLTVHPASPEEHDRELAYVQGLTHLLMKVVVSLDLPKFRFTTRTYEYLEQMVEMIRYDSEELFRAIERENPFSKEAKQRFFAAARKLEDELMRG